jgi:hypothetical protein
MNNAAPDAGWPAWRAEEHDFDEIAPPPSPAPVNWAVEDEPGDDDEDGDQGDDEDGDKSDDED